MSHGFVVPAHLASTYGMSGLSIEQFDRLRWAIDLFRRADLWLPPLVVYAFSTTDRCSGRAGSAPRGGEVDKIHLCLSASEPTFDWILIHELAHVWSRAAVTDEQRSSFLALRSLVAWDEGDWHQRGAEHAAEIIVWGLMDRPVVTGHISNTNCQELMVSYRALTDRRPLHRFNQRCQ